jgi:hypothetical protein
MAQAVSRRPLSAEARVRCMAGRDFQGANIHLTSRKRRRRTRSHTRENQMLNTIYNTAHVTALQTRHRHSGMDRLLERFRPKRQSPKSMPTATGFRISTPIFPRMRLSRTEKGKGIKTVAKSTDIQDTHHLRHARDTTKDTTN